MKVRSGQGQVKICNRHAVCERLVMLIQYNTIQKVQIQLIKIFASKVFDAARHGDSNGAAVGHVFWSIVFYLVLLHVPWSRIPTIEFVCLR